MTWLMSSRSRPRAATSVATSVVALAGAEALERLLARGLRHVAVHRDGRDAAPRSFSARRSAPRFVRTKTRASSRSASSSSISRSILSSRDRDEVCSTASPSCRHGPLGLEAARVARVRAGELADLAVERGREEHRLALGGQPAEDLLHLRAEAHVEHAVGLVEHEDRDVVDATRRRSIRSCSRPGVATRMCAPCAALPASCTRRRRRRPRRRGGPCGARASRARRPPAARARASGRARAPPARTVAGERARRSGSRRRASCPSPSATWRARHVR